MIRLEYELRERGISQTEFADVTGINRTIINRLVCGALAPYPGWKSRIVDALEWQGHADELFEEISIGDDAK